MSSFVYFKFKSQKDPTRVTIDGPHTDVWNLKREIINISRLGDGTDFDLKIFKENTNEEYTDDTEIIPKDSTVIAKRQAAAVPGKGRAARYVSGKPPASAKPMTTAARNQIAAAMDSAMSEEEKLKLTMKMMDAQWQEKQEQMSHDTRINIAGQKNFSKKANVPEGEPPHGYICFRCNQKGHWIQACPKNDDPAYDGKPRIKKTTGIPRSMLQKVDKSEIDNLEGVMVTSEGEFVLAQADKKTWKKFQDQKNATDEANKTVQAGDKELQELGLECPIDKRMFVDPMKTPCCGKTYCHECIENALIDNDFQCPNCQSEMTLERLEPDEEAKIKIKELANRQDGSSTAGSPKIEEVSSRPGSRDGSKSPKSPSSVAGRKRTASEATETKDSLTVPAPVMKRQKSSGSEIGTPKPETASKVSTTNSSNGNDISGMPSDMQAMLQQMQNMPNMNMNMNMGFPGMMTPFMPNMNMNMNMMNPMMMGMMNGGMNGMNGLSGMNGMPNFNNMASVPMNNMPLNGNLPNNNYNNNMNGNHGQGWNNNQYSNNRGGYKNNKKFNNFQKTSSPAPQQPQTGLENVPKGPKAMSTGPPAGVPTGPAAANKFSNQQRHQGNEEDNAYMRQPVNPQRAINRDKGRRGMRNAEYKEL